MADTVSQLATNLLAAATDRPRYLLGIAGTPGSGKSTLAAALVEVANAREGEGFAAALGLDGYHYPNAHLDAHALRPRKGAAWTYDGEAFVATLEALRDGRDVVAPLYDRTLHDPVVDGVRIPASVRLVIVEGNYFLLDEPPWDRIPPLLDETWHMDTPLEVSMARTEARHVRGGCSPEEAAAKIARNDRPNGERINQAAGRADRLIASA